MPQLERPIRYAVAALAVLALAACGSEDPQPVPPEGDGGTTTAAPATVAVEQVYRDVRFYGACGNEVLHHQGATLYPLLPEELDGFDESPYRPEATASGADRLGQTPGVVLAAAGAPGLVAVAPALPAVPAPGPGDDVGTLTVYEDGTAHFISDSGSIETWLTDELRTYSWDC